LDRKKAPTGRTVVVNEYVQEAVVKSLRKQTKEFFADGI
jgi:hypothetical protein